MVSPVPNGGHLIGNVESGHNSVEDSYVEYSEEESDDSEESDKVESSPSAEARTERHSKQTQYPSDCQSKAVVSSARNPKST